MGFDQQIACKLGVGQRGNGGGGVQQMNWSGLLELYAKVLRAGGLLFYPSTTHHVPTDSINVIKALLLSC
jgi:hypothetical protein